MIACYFGQVKVVEYLLTFKEINVTLKSTDLFVSIFRHKFTYRFKNIYQNLGKRTFNYKNNSQQRKFNNCFIRLLYIGQLED